MNLARNSMAGGPRHARGGRDTDLLEGLADGVIGLDATATITRFNRAAESITGWERAAVIGHSMHAVLQHTGVDGAAYPPSASPILRTLADGCARRGTEEWFWRRDGGIFPVAWTSAALHDSDGGIAGAVVTFSDSSRQLDEAGYRTLVTASARFVWRCAPDGSLREVSEEWLGLTGLSAEHARGAGWLDAIHPDDRNACRERWLAAVERREVYATEYRLCCRDGRTRWFTVHGAPILDHEGGVVEWVGAAHEITMRKQAELELEREREQYRTLVESTSAILWEGDPATLGFTFVSHEAESLLGYPVERWTTETDFWVDHMHPEDRAWAPDYCARATAERRAHTFDYRMIAADGRTVWLRDVVSVLLEDDRPARLVGVMVDITATKELEFRLRYVEGLQRTLVGISRRFVEYETDAFDAAIEDALARVGQYCGVDRSYLFRFVEGECLVNTHEWCAEGIEPQIDDLQALPNAELPSLVERIRDDEVVHMPDVDRLAGAWATERAFFRAIGIQSLILVPVSTGETIHGFIGFDSVARPREWSEDEIGLLRGLADLIGTMVERDRSERARRDSEARFRAIAEHLPGNVYQRVRSPDGTLRISYVSPSIRSVFGIDPERARAEPGYILDCIHPDDRALYSNELRRSAETLTAHDFEFRIRGEEGPYHWVRSIARPRLASDGSIVWDGIGIDESERKEAELELRETRALLEMAGRAAGLGGWKLDVDASRLVLSAETCALLGLPAGSCPSVDDVIALHPQDWQAHLRRLLEGCLSMGRGFEQEAPLTTVDGRSLWVRLIGEAVLDETGRVSQIRGACQDITREHRDREAAERLARRLNNTLESITDAFFIVDGEWRFTHANQQAERLLQKPRAALLERVVWEAFPEAVGTRIEEEFRRAVRDGTSVDIEEYYPPLETWFEIHAYPSEEGLAVYFRDVTERRRQQEEIEFLALYDPLTRLPNRRLLLDRLQQALAASERAGRHGALLFLDLDHFKTLNDTLGHDFGDRMLKQVAERLLTCVRESDTVARFGGDEFAIVLGDLAGDASTATSRAEQVAQKVVDTLTEPYWLGEYQRHTTVSVGITLFRDASEASEELMKRVDLAMYQAKDSGRSTVRMFEPSMRAAIQSRVELESELRAALKRDELVPWYQPQFDAAGRVIGAEALARWQRPDQRPVSPAEFIDVAEQAGLIRQLGEVILERTCERLADWAARVGGERFSVAVNVSARQFHHPRFVEQVQAIIERTGAPAEHLCLELTESLLVVDVEDTVLKMDQLRGLGLRFSLDDFGTGYSSLAYLKRLPLDELKIDQGFVRDALEDPNDAAIVRTIIVLARTMGLDVIAEGVETDAVRALLAAHGCLAYQGYLFGHPMAVDDFDAWLGRQIGP